MKKFLILLFVFYASFINCDHEINWDEKRVFIETALQELANNYLDVLPDCLDKKFEANLNFSLLFTTPEKYEDDLKNIENYFSSSVMDYLKNNKDQEGLIDLDNKLDNGSYQKMVLFKTIIHDDDCFGIMLIEAQFSGDVDGEELLKCPFILAADNMLNEVDLTQLGEQNYLVFSFKYSQ
jgi:hypothetical protein